MSSTAPALPGYIVRSMRLRHAGEAMLAALHDVSLVCGNFPDDAEVREMLAKVDAAIALAEGRDQ